MITINLHSDEALIKLIELEDRSAFKQVYRNCNNYCINFLKSYGANNEDADDIFQDAMMLFYEKVQQRKFDLKSSIKTYINSICKNMWFNMIRDKKEFTVPDDFNFDSEINDWNEEFHEEKENKIQKLEKALEIIDTGTGKCKELIRLYFYQNKSMKEIADYFGYTNADNAKNQKARCQKRLTDLVKN